MNAPAMKLKATGANLVGLCGHSGVGKDVASQVLVDGYGFRRIAVADHLKCVTALAFALDHEQLWGDRRNQVDARWGRTPREMYQLLGDALRSIAPDAVTRGWVAEVRTSLEVGVAVVVPDIRLPAERDAVTALGGILVRVVSPGRGLVGTVSTHHTERASDDFEVDAELDNSGSLTELQGQVRAVMDGRCQLGAKGLLRP